MEDIYILYVVVLVLFVILCYMHVVFSEMYWSKLPDGLLKNLVDLFKKEAAMLIDRIAVVKFNSDIEKLLLKFVQILQRVYQVLLLNIT